MKTKVCALCHNEFNVLYRIQIEKDKTWIFACKECMKKNKKLPNYKYGGTWKGKRH